jgi:hypothetical protein
LLLIWGEENVEEEDEEEEEYENNSQEEILKPQGFTRCCNDLQTFTNSMLGQKEPVIPPPLLFGLEVPQVHH